LLLASAGKIPPPTPFGVKVCGTKKSNQDWLTFALRSHTVGVQQELYINHYSRKEYPMDIESNAILTLTLILLIAYLINSRYRK
jgi:hypothetical protein